MLYQMKYTSDLIEQTLELPTRIVLLKLKFHASLKSLNYLNLTLEITLPNVTLLEALWILPCSP